MVHADGTGTIAKSSSRRSVPFICLMDPPDLSNLLFGENFASLCAVGGKSLSPVAFSNLESEAAKIALAEAEVLITGWGAPVLSVEQMDAAPNLKFVLHAGGLADGFVPKGTAKRNIQTSNAGWVNSMPVAEFTYAMIILANKQAFSARRIYRDTRAEVLREVVFPSAGNCDKTIGLVGASRIGRMVMERLGELDVAIKLYDPYVDASIAQKFGAQLVTLDELMASSDIVSLHQPLNEETTGMIKAEHLELMKSGATLINTARGAVVDQDALVKLLQAGRIEAILDVTDPEVLPADHPLYTLPNVFLTPHISGSMGTEVTRMGAQIASELSRVVDGRPLAFLEAII